MWYDLLPGAGALILVLYLPHVVCPMIEGFFQGNRFYKNTDYPEVANAWQRDMYLTGNGNRPTRVDAIPDLPETNQSEKSA